MNPPTHPRRNHKPGRASEGYLKAKRLSQLWLQLSVDGRSCSLQVEQMEARESHAPAQQIVVLAADSDGHVLQMHQLQLLGVGAETLSTEAIPSGFVHGSERQVVGRLKDEHS